MSTEGHGCADAIRVTPLPAGGALRLRFDPTPPPEPDTLLMMAWEHLRAANPRLYNAPMLALSAMELTPSDTTLSVRLETYQRFAAQGMLPILPPVVQLSVTAVLRSRDAQGAEHVLLGKRGPGVRIYPNQWELGPSGGVDAPKDAADAAGLDGSYLIEQLQREISEELSRMVPIASATPIALVHDDLAYSCDVVYLVESRATPWPTDADPVNWEYAGTEWVRTTDIAAFAREHTDIIPPTRALFALLGWV